MNTSEKCFAVGTTGLTVFIKFEHIAIVNLQMLTIIKGCVGNNNNPTANNHKIQKICDGNKTYSV